MRGERAADAELSEPKRNTPAAQVGRLTSCTITTGLMSREKRKEKKRKYSRAITVLLITGTENLFFFQSKENLILPKQLLKVIL